MVKRITTEDFIKKARSIHGNKYDYSFACYLSAKSNIKIICPIHGLFEQQAYIHAKGSGCPDCSEKKKKTTAQFIKEARQVHGDRYDYSQSVYLSANKKIEIICPDHGSFLQVPPSHLKQGAGCPKCAGNAKRSTPSFIGEAKKIHGEKYDYSKTEYINDGSKDGTTLTIICPVHGEFKQRGAVHLKGAGCNKCGHGETAKKRRKTQEDFIKEARNKHGEKYDYSKAEYKGDKYKVEIICPEHGGFWQSAGGHLQGKGCISCYRNRQRIERTHDTDTFAEKAKKIHTQKYDYSKSNYKSAQTKIEIICPEHGSFWQTPNGHLGGKGCKKCAADLASKRYRMTDAEFIAKAQSIHGDKYDYRKVEYKLSRTKVEIICPVHGSFWQTPNSHVSGLGCDKCGGTYTISREDAIHRAKKRHGDKYDYSKVVFKTIRDKVEIICPDHGSFYQQMQSHFMKCGCPKCANYGFNPKLPSIIYFLKIQTVIATFWKIGITNRTVKDRFRKDYDSIQSGWFWHGNGDAIWEAEQELLRQYQSHKLSYLFPLLQNGGDSECFTLNLPVKKVISYITAKLKSPPEVFQRT